MSHYTGQPDSVVTDLTLQSDTIFLRSEGAVSFPETEQNDFKIYPNPSAGVFFIETYSDKLQQTTHVKIFNTTGSIIYQQELSSCKYTVDLEENK